MDERKEEKKIHVPHHVLQSWEFRGQQLSASSKLEARMNECPQSCSLFRSHYDWINSHWVGRQQPKRSIKRLTRKFNSLRNIFQPVTEYSYSITLVYMYLLHLCVC